MDAAALVAFLRARLGEDERAARAEGHHDPYAGSPDAGGYYACPAVHTEPFGDLPWGEDNCDCGLDARRARGLTDVAAKRAILAEHSPATFTDVDLGIRDAQVCQVCHVVLGPPDDLAEAQADEWRFPLVQAPWPCRTVRLLAQPYTDDPGFDPSWAIEGFAADTERVHET